MTTFVDVLYSILVFSGSLFLVLLVSLADAYKFGYGFTFGTITAKRRIGVIAVHAVEEKIERPFKQAACDIHKAEDVVHRQVQREEHEIKEDLKHLDK